MNSKKIRFLVLGCFVLGLGLVVTVNFTNACRLRTVTLDGRPVENWAVEFGMLRPAPLVSQPVDELAKTLLADDDVYKVDVSYRLPGELAIQTNEFEPVCFVVGQETGKLFGLNRRVRLIALDARTINWEQPVFTGLRTGNLHSFCDDPRVLLVVEQLEEMRRTRVDLYRLVDEVDFSEREYLDVMVAGVPYHLQVRPDHLLRDFDRFVEFTRNYEADLTGVVRMDLRYEDMVICALSDKEMKRRAEEARAKAKAEAEAEAARAAKD